ncbi:MAG: PGDYG domain-containing protein [Flavobacteriaceae bacterium]
MRVFKKDQVPDLDFKEAVKKPIPVRCVQIHEPFSVETMEGLMQGKPGDWLMVGIHGEMYPIDKDIFEKTYDLC